MLFDRQAFAQTEIDRIPFGFGGRHGGHLLKFRPPADWIAEQFDQSTGAAETARFDIEIGIDICSEIQISRCDETDLEFGAARQVAEHTFCCA